VNTSKLTGEFDQDRRRFLGAAVVAAGAAGAGRFGMTARPGAGSRAVSASAASFGSLHQINAGVLNVPQEAPREFAQAVIDADRF